MSPAFSMHVGGVSILISTACQLLSAACFGGNPGIFGPHHGGSMIKYVEQKVVELKRVIAFTNWIRLPVVNVGANIKM